MGGVYICGLRPPQDSKTVCFIRKTWLSRANTKTCRRMGGGVPNIETQIYITYIYTHLFTYLSILDVIVYIYIYRYTCYIYRERERKMCIYIYIHAHMHAGSLFLLVRCWKLQQETRFEV